MWLKNWGYRTYVQKNLNCGQFQVIPHNHYAREKLWSCDKSKKHNRTSPKMATALVWQALFLCLLGDHVPRWSHWTTWVWLLLLCWFQNLWGNHRKIWPWILLNRCLDIYTLYQHVFGDPTIIIWDYRKQISNDTTCITPGTWQDQSGQSHCANAIYMVCWH